jgi:iron complex outermembrane receptor protein
MVLADWRLIAAYARDDFDVPVEPENTYQVILTKSINDRNIFRLVYHEAIRQHFHTELFQDFNVSFPAGNATFTAIGTGNPDLEFLRTKTTEIGLRSELNESVFLDAEVWISKVNNFTAADSTFLDRFTNVSSFITLPLSLEQIGLTTSINYRLNNNLTSTFFITYQETQLKDAYPDLSTRSTLEDRSHDSTPKWFGGFTLNYSISDQWHWHVNCYSVDDRQMRRFRSRDRIDTILLLSTRLTYQYDENISFFITGNNVGDSDKNEFGFTDSSQEMYLIGFEFLAKD